MVLPYQFRLLGQDLKDEIGMVTLGEKYGFMGSTMPPSKRGGVPASQNFGGLSCLPYLHPNGLTYSDKIWHSNMGE